MTYTATPQQEVWMMKHHVWSKFDDGLTPEQVTNSLIEEGRPPEVASLFVEKHASMAAASTHSIQEREAMIETLRAAVQAGDQDGILNAMEPACDDDRTLYKMFSALSWLLFDPPPACQWAAFGLSKIVGYGDFALVQALQHDNEFNRYVAAFGLGTMGAEAANTLNALQAAAEDTSPLVRDAAAESIQRIQQDLQQRS